MGLQIPRLDSLAVEFQIDRVECIEQSDDPLTVNMGPLSLGKSEPFLLNFFFRIDGASVNLLSTFTLSGKAITSIPSGSHGNLGTTSVESGDKVDVPSATGLWKTELKPIQLPPPCNLALPTGVSGAIGLVTVLMERGMESTAAMNDAQKAFGATLTSILNNDVIPSLGIASKTFSPSQQQMDEWETQVESAMTAAILNKSSGLLETLQLGLEPPRLLGLAVLVFPHRKLQSDVKKFLRRPTKTLQFARHFEDGSALTPSSGKPAFGGTGSEEWSIFGHITAIGPVHVGQETLAAPVGASHFNEGRTIEWGLKEEVPAAILSAVPKRKLISRGTGKDIVVERPVGRRFGKGIVR